MTNDPFKAACVQLRCGLDIKANLDDCAGFIREAAAEGAELVLTPENTGAISAVHAMPHGDEATFERHPALPFFSSLASELSIWLAIGSVGIFLGDGKYANRSLAFSPKGELIAYYDKMHMFDVQVSETETWRESDQFTAGERAVLVDLPWGKLGLTICYDLRFPELYRDIARAGVSFVTIPSAFTVPTGQAHWHVLLRARAIETGCYVFAPAQSGTHENGRVTYGHTLIVDPWGEISGELETDTGWIMAEIDPARVQEARRRLPSLKHDQAYSLS